MLARDNGIFASLAALKWWRGANQCQPAFLRHLLPLVSLARTEENQCRLVR